MQNLTHLRNSHIDDQASLPSTMKCLTRLENLTISGDQMLNLEFDSFENLKSFTIYELPLVTLPHWLGKLPRLQTLIIVGCRSLSSLPEGLHHLSLLKIFGCPNLKERCQPQIGQDWQKIAHVQKIEVDHIMIKSSRL